MWANRFYILLMSMYVLFSCGAQQDKEENYKRILNYWETRTESAVRSCDDSLAINTAWRTIKLIDDFNLRSRVLRKVFELTDFSAESYLVEANSGDDKTYSVYVTTPSIDSSIYVVKFDMYSDTLQVSRVLNTDKEYSWYRRYFNGWDDYIDSVTEDQKIFLCGSKDLQYETIFQLTIPPP
jgi:hypothetical protein